MRGFAHSMFQVRALKRASLKKIIPRESATFPPTAFIIISLGFFADYRSLIF